MSHSILRPKVSGPYTASGLRDTDFDELKAKQDITERQINELDEQVKRFNLVAWLMVFLGCVLIVPGLSES